VVQLADLEALEGNKKNRNRGASARAQSNLPSPAALNQDPNREILAVLPRLRRYARILTRDVAAADDLVQDCIARALEKIDLWEQGTDLRAWMFTRQRWPAALPLQCQSVSENLLTCRWESRLSAPVNTTSASCSSPTPTSGRRAGRRR
jgi:Sigma2 domain of PhyR